MKKGKFVIAGMIVLLTLGFLGYKSFVASATYYYEVSEFVGQETTFSGKNVRVAGIVVDGSIEKQGTILRFTMTEGDKALPVVYKGLVPDSFKAGAEAVVEGKLNAAGAFEATTLLAKCPSKYEPETPQSQ